MCAHAHRASFSTYCHALRAFVPYVFSCLSCFVLKCSCLTGLTYSSCTSHVLRLAFSSAARASCRTCSFAPHISLASGASSLIHSSNVKLVKHLRLNVFAQIANGFWSLTNFAKRTVRLGSK